MILAIVGPTGVGKTALSIALAKRYQAEIINFDSMQVYEQLDIGTAKVTKKEMDGVTHHLLSYVPVDEAYHVYAYQQTARKVLDTLLQQGKNVILVGGTGLYLKALLYDYRFETLENTNSFDNWTNEALAKEIRKYDKDIIFDVNNRRRMIPLLNKLQQQKEIANQGTKPLYDFQIIGLTLPREHLYQRINQRVDTMFEHGLLEEVTNLQDHYSTSKALQNGIGYKEFLPYFKNECSLEEVKEAIKQHSRRYAKRQYTFFKHQLPVKWYEVCEEDFSIVVEHVIMDIERK